MTLKVFAILPIPLLLLACSDPFQTEVKERVAYKLKDPASAEFREVDFYPEVKLACGEVNGKNSYGAKSGFSGFTYDNGMVDFEGEFGYSSGLAKCTDQVRKRTKEILESLPAQSREELERELQRYDQE
jgi:hypothetical protein